MAWFSTHNRVLAKILPTILIQPTFSESLSRSNNSALSHGHYLEAPAPDHPGLSRRQKQNVLSLSDKAELSFSSAESHFPHLHCYSWVRKSSLGSRKSLVCWGALTLDACSLLKWLIFCWPVSSYNFLVHTSFNSPHSNYLCLDFIQ